MMHDRFKVGKLTMASALLDLPAVCHRKISKECQLHQPKSLADRVGKVLDVSDVCDRPDVGYIVETRTLTRPRAIHRPLIIVPLANLSFWDDPLVQRVNQRGALPRQAPFLSSLITDDVSESFLFMVVFLPFYDTTESFRCCAISQRKQCNP